MSRSRPRFFRPDESAPGESCSRIFRKLWEYLCPGADIRTVICSQPQRKWLMNTVTRIQNEPLPVRQYAVWATKAGAENTTVLVPFCRLHQIAPAPSILETSADTKQQSIGICCLQHTDDTRVSRFKMLQKSHCTESAWKIIIISWHQLKAMCKSDLRHIARIKSFLNEGPTSLQPHSAIFSHQVVKSIPLDIKTKAIVPVPKDLSNQKFDTCLLPCRLALPGGRMPQRRRTRRVCICTTNISTAFAAQTIVGTECGISALHPLSLSEKLAGWSVLCRATKAFQYRAGCHCPRIRADPNDAHISTCTGTSGWLLPNFSSFLFRHLRQRSRWQLRSPRSWLNVRNCNIMVLSRAEPALSIHSIIQNAGNIGNMAIPHHPARFIAKLLQLLRDISAKTYVQSTCDKYERSTDHRGSQGSASDCICPKYRLVQLCGPRRIKGSLTLCVCKISLIVTWETDSLENLVRRRYGCHPGGQNDDTKMITKRNKMQKKATMQKDRKRSAPLFFKYANKMPKHAHKMKKGPRRMYEYKEQIDSKRCPKTNNTKRIRNIEMLKECKP